MANGLVWGWLVGLLRGRSGAVSGRVMLVLLAGTGLFTRELVQLSGAATVVPFVGATIVALALHGLFRRALARRQHLPANT